MNTKHTLFLGFSIFLMMISCSKIEPKGDIEIQNVNVEDFKGLNLKGKFRVFYIYSTENFVEVQTYPNIFKNLNIKVSDSTLNIIENRKTQNVDFYSITIYSKNYVKNIAVSDSVELNTSGEINTQNLKINLKNYAKFIGALKTQNTNLEMQDKSSANFVGFTKFANIKISDSCGIIAPFWKIDQANIISKNAAFAELNVKDSIKGSIENTSQFLYYNNPIRAFKIDQTANVQNKILE